MKVHLKSCPIMNVDPDHVGFCPQTEAEVEDYYSAKELADTLILKVRENMRRDRERSRI